VLPVAVITDDVLPRENVATIHELVAPHEDGAMVVAGTDVEFDTADVVLRGDDFSKIPDGPGPRHAGRSSSISPSSFAHRDHPSQHSKDKCAPED
jgi:hypothetical protein